MASDKREKLYFLHSAPGYGYHAGETEDVPVKMAREFKKQGIARSATETLPEDLPARDKLMIAGFETEEEVEEIEDFSEVDGIGTDEARALEAYFGREEKGDSPEYSGEGGLPEDMPGAPHFEKAGYTSVDEVLALEDPTEVKYIGDLTAAELAEWAANREE